MIPQFINNVFYDLEKDGCICTCVGKMVMVMWSPSTEFANRKNILPNSCEWNCLQTEEFMNQSITVFLLAAITNYHKLHGLK